MTRPTTAPHGGRRGLRLALVAAGTALLTSGCDGRYVYEQAFSFGWSKPITPQGQRMYDLWLGSMAAASAVGLGVLALILITVVFHRKRGDELPMQVRYNLPIEVLYTFVPFVIIAVLFYYTARDENYVDKLGKADVNVTVVGQQWQWQFDYTDANVLVQGASGVAPRLVLPVNRSIRFTEISPDVIHSFYVPKFLFKRDVVPGRANQFQISKITQMGHYIGRCAEYCGEKHSQMDFYVDVVSQADYDAFIAKLKADPNAQMTKDTLKINGYPDHVAGAEQTERSK